MNLSRSQIIIIFSVVFVVLFFVGIFTGILPGSRIFTQKPPEVSLLIWGTDDREFFQDAITEYQLLRTNVAVKYEQLTPDNYEQKVLNALAANAGPDIMMFHNTWLLKHFDKIVPVSETQLNRKSLQEFFPTVIEQDFASTDKIYALPLYIDTLALLYNQDTFDKKGIAIPPKDWLDFQNLIPKLIEKNSDGTIAKAAAAIGGSDSTIASGPDLLMLLMLQAGAKMTNEDFSVASFAQGVDQSRPGADALIFYTKFSDPRDIYYTWNESLDYSLDSFSNGDTAMIFGYADTRNLIKEKNPFINFKVAEMPQPAGSDKAVNYPDYWGLAVTNNSQNADWAWDFILYATANDAVAEKYLVASNRPPALRTLIKKYTDHPTLGVFAKQALSARSWMQLNGKLNAGIFSEMIKSVLGNQLSITDALYQAEREVTESMQSGR